MMKRLSFLSLALCFASACVINDDGDDAGDGSTSNDTTPTTTNGNTAPSTMTTPADDDGDSGSTAAGSSGEPPADSSGTAGPADSTASDSGGSGDTAAGGACGWGKTTQKKVPMGYVCGGDGADPEGMYPLDCPEDTELTEGGACGMVRGQGCCDANGDVWFCATQDGGDPMLFTDDCM